MAVAQTGQLRSWECGDLPLECEVLRKGVRFTVFPALQDRHDSVTVVELGNAIHAEQVMRQGVLRLVTLAVPQQYKFARQQFAGNKQLLLLGQGSSGEKPLADALAERALRECFLPEAQLLPRNQAEFSRLIETHRSELNDVVSRLANTMLSLFTEWRAVRQDLTRLNTPVFKPALTGH
jgi:ATP-dependent helicase HrpA